MNSGRFKGITSIEDMLGWQKDSFNTAFKINDSGISEYTMAQIQAKAAIMDLTDELTTQSIALAKDADFSAKAATGKFTWGDAISDAKTSYEELGNALLKSSSVSNEAKDTLRNVTKEVGKNGDAYKNVVKNIIDGSAGFGDISDDFIDLGDSFQKSSSMLSSTADYFKGLYASIKPLIPVVAALGVAFAAYKAVDYATHGYTRAVEDAQKAAEEYANVQSELDSLNSTYDQQKDKIRELQALKANESISMEQENELSRLEQQNSALETQIMLQQNLLKIKQGESADAAKKAADEEMSYMEAMQKEYGKFQGFFVGLGGYLTSYTNEDGLTTTLAQDWKNQFGGDTSEENRIRTYIDQLNDYEAELANVQEQLAEKPDDKGLLQQQEDLNSKIEETSKNLQGASETINGWIQQSVDENGVALAGMEEDVDRWRGLMTDFANRGKDQPEIDFNNLKNLFSSTGGDKIEKRLKNIAKNGGTAADALKEFQSLGLSLDELNISEDGFIRYFKDLQKAAKEAEETVKNVGNNLSMGDIATAFESENAGTDYVSFNDYLKQAKELYDQGLVGTDEFKAVTEMMTYNLDSSAEAFAASYDKIKNYFTEDADGNLTGAGVNNFLTELQALNKGYATWDENAQKWNIDINNTAQAAKELGVGVGVFEAVLGRIKDYDGIGDFNFVSALEEFDEASTALENLKAIYDSMDDGSDRDALGEKLKQWTPLIENAEQDLASLPHEVVTQLKFEYDKAQLQQEAEKATRLAEKSGFQDSSYNASAIVASEDYKAELAKGFDMSTISEQSIPIYFDAENALQNLNAQLASGDLDQETTVKVQGEIVNLLNLQNDISEAFQNAHPEITPETDTSIAQATFDEWVKSTEGQEIIAKTTLEYQEVIDKISDLINQDYGEVKINVNAIDNASKVIQSVEEQDLRDKFTQLVGEDQATPLIYIWNGLQADPHFTSLNAVDQASYVVTLWNNMSPEEKTVVMTAADQSATATASNVTGAVENIPDSSNTTITADDAATSVIQSVMANMFMVDGRVAHTYIYNHVIDTHESKGGTQLVGTAHMNGTLGGLYPIPKLSGRALAMGTLQDDSWLNPNWRTKKSEVALTGEEGMELVATRQNRWFTVGDNGAEFAHIPAGSVVFNARQTKELFSKGYTNSRGTSHLSGTAYLSGASYLGSASGSFSFGGGASSYNPPGSGSSYSDTASAASSASQAIDNATDSAEEFAEELDYIEIAIDRIERQISEIERIADSAFETFSTRNDALRKQISAITSEISTQQAGYERYIQAANSVGLSEDYAQKIRDGVIDLETITDETLHDSISQYKDYYEKALDCRDAVGELTESVRELYQQEFENVVSLYDNIIDTFEHQKNMIESSIDQMDAQGMILEQKSAYLELIANEEESLKKLNEKRSALVNSLNTALSEGNIQKDSEAYYDMQKEINEVDEAIQDATTSIIDFKNEIKDLYIEQFDSVEQQYDNIVSLLEHRKNMIDSFIDQSEAEGFFISEQYYTALIGNEQETLNNLTKKREDLLAALQDGMKNGGIKQYSNEWYENSRHIIYFIAGKSPQPYLATT
mgnify:FL=1